jgi:hypothetical protein
MNVRTKMPKRERIAQSKHHAAHEPVAQHHAALDDSKVDPYTLPLEEFRAYMRRHLSLATFNDVFKTGGGLNESAQLERLNRELVSEGYPALKRNPALAPEALEAAHKQRIAARAEIDRVQRERRIAHLQTLPKKEKLRSVRPKRERAALVERKADELYVVTCTECGDLKVRKHFSDANGWWRTHRDQFTSKDPKHVVTIETRKEVLCQKSEKPSKAIRTAKIAANSLAKKTSVTAPVKTAAKKLRATGKKR